jgi:FAD dependent oxidoreductase TIGR03364
LAHAHEALKRGNSVIVIERDERCLGASIRNFGFVTVSGLRGGDIWRRAVSSRDEWLKIAPEAGIDIEHRGTWLSVRHPLAWSVAEAFAATEMGEEVELVGRAELASRAPLLDTDGAIGALYSPHEVRVESVTAIPSLTRWLGERGVHFLWGEEVLATQGGTVWTSTREIHGERVVLCPGNYLSGVGQEYLAPYDITFSKLQMLRIRPRTPVRFDAAVMNELSLARYQGYADLPEAKAWGEHLDEHEPELRAAGIHLIAVQSADGSVVIGDSHDYGNDPDPFASESVDRMILDQFHRTTRVKEADVISRWVGVYPTAEVDCVIEAPSPQQRIVVVTSGKGASTGFGIARDVFDSWDGQAA